MSLLGQLWVKLGLKNDDFKKGIEESKGKTEQFGDKIKKMSVAAKAAWAAVGAAVIKLGSDMVKQTQVIGDKWAVFTSGLNAAYGEFVSRIGSGKGWDNLIANMIEANRVGREVAAMMDELFEMNSSISIQEAKFGVEIAKNEKIYRDVTKTNEERANAIKRNLELEKQLLEWRKTSAQQELQAAILTHTQKVKMSDEERKYFVEDYIANHEKIKEVTEHMNALKDVEEQLGRLRTAWRTSDMEYTEFQKQESVLIAKKTALQAQEIENYDFISQGITKLNLGNDEVHTTLTNAIVKMANAEEQFERNTLRAQVTLSRLNDELAETQALINGGNVGTALLDVVIPKSKVSIDDNGKEINKMMDDFLSFEMPEHDLSAVDEFNKKLEDGTRRTQELANVFHSAVVDSVVSAVSELSEALASGESLSSGKFISAVLTPLADAAISAGTLILSTGLGIEGILESLSTLDPVAAIAAGTALIAIGTAAKVGLASIAEQGNTTPSYSYSGGYGFNVAAQVPQDYEVKVTGTLKGQDIYLASEKYQQSRRR